MINKILTVTAIMIVLATVFLFGIDREVARQDYLDGKVAQGCIFNVNCKYYNNLD